MTFLSKSYDEWNKVEKPALVPLIYQVSDEKEVEMVLDYNENNSFMLLIGP